MIQAGARRVGSIYCYPVIYNFAIFPNVSRQRSKPGVELRSIRQSLGFSMRDVHAASLKIAKRLNDHRFVIPPTRLHAIEAKNATPSLWRLYTLAVVYGRTVEALLSFYGIDVKPTK